MLNQVYFVPKWLRRPLTLVALVGFASGIAWWSVHRLQAFPEPPVPADFGPLDPEVTSLVHQTRAEVREAPRNADRRARLGMVYEANGLTELARQSYEQALLLDDSETTWWYRLALVRARSGDNDRAVEAIQQSIARNDRYAPAHRQLGFWMLDRGDVEQAEASFRRAMKTDAADPGGWHGLARTLLQRRQNEQAAELLEKFLANHPRDWYARQLLGTAYRHLGRWDQAEAALIAGAKAEPVWSDPWSEELVQFRRGFAAVLREAERRFRAGQPDVAITLLKELRARKPDDLTVLNNLGAAYLSIGEINESLRVLKSAETRNPDRFETHLNLSNAYMRHGEPDRALRHAERATALNPTHAKAHEVKGLILRQVGQRDRAIESFQEAVRLDPNNLLPLVWIGMIQKDAKRTNEALATFQQVVRQDPTLADAFLGIATIKMNLGALEDAEAALARASQLNPFNPELQAAEARLRTLRRSRGTARQESR